MSREPLDHLRGDLAELLATSYAPAVTARARSGRSSMRSRRWGFTGRRSADSRDPLERFSRRPSSQIAVGRRDHLARSSERSSVLPSRSNSRSWRSRSNLGWRSSESSPISSRKIVPSWAKLEAADALRDHLGEGAPLVPHELAARAGRSGWRAQLTLTKRPFLRWLSSWSARAISLLPRACLAVNQHRRVGRRHGLHLLSTLRSAALSPMISPMTAGASSPGAQRARRPPPSARAAAPPALAAVARLTRASRVEGLVKKSTAPALPDQGYGDRQRRRGR